MKSKFQLGNSFKRLDVKWLQSDPEWKNYQYILKTEAPAMVDTFIYAIYLLLGIDSVTGIWKNFEKQ